MLTIQNMFMGSDEVGEISVNLATCSLVSLKNIGQRDQQSRGKKAE